MRTSAGDVGSSCSTPASASASPAESVAVITTTSAARPWNSARVSSPPSPQRTSGSPASINQPAIDFASARFATTSTLGPLWDTEGPILARLSPYELQRRDRIDVDADPDARRPTGIGRLEAADHRAE